MGGLVFNTWVCVDVVVVGGDAGLPREGRWMMVCGYKKLFFPRENHVSLPCLVEAILAPRIGGFDM